MSTGKVWLLGAGPGDIGLFTLKGMEVLQKAEVVVYDNLVGQGVLSKVPETARLVYVGKRAGHHTMPQDRINEILLEEAQKGFRVVRLKGGDPFLFGRGGEELELLCENKIPYEVVPGVTSPLAVPAYNGIPVTHRDYCSSLHIITGHKKAGMESEIPFEALVKTGGTLVFLMGVTALPDICKGLLKAGMDPDMPAAILQRGTTAQQKRIVATVSTLEEETRRQGVMTPAIIVVGRVCALAEKFAWYEQLPLSGWRVLLTRPRELLSVTAAKLREQGAEVVELPAIRVQPKEDALLDSVLEHVEAYDWLVFTSPTGVRIFFEKMYTLGRDIRSLFGCKVAVIGEGSRRELEKRGLFADLMPKVYDGEHLGRELAEKCRPGERVLIPRAEKGNKELVRILEEQGVQVTDIATYETVYETSALIDEKKAIENGEIDCVVFTSASTVKGFVAALSGAEYSGDPKEALLGNRGGIDYTKIRAACIGKQTKAAADAYGMQTEMAKAATIDSLVELVADMKGRDSKWN
ncbi:MAG: uroporphyrinogen-III C-methyltransferase [Eubacteriales bacterium]|nr:uroporphyrinogen-III C-methyltransferase [Eubacteriales bacterium]